jgi:hypothetical protein
VVPSDLVAVAPPRRVMAAMPTHFAAVAEAGQRQGACVTKLFSLLKRPSLTWARRLAAALTGAASVAVAVVRVAAATAVVALTNLHMDNSIS